MQTKPKALLHLTLGIMVWLSVFISSPIGAQQTSLDKRLATQHLSLKTNQKPFSAMITYLVLDATQTINGQMASQLMRGTFQHFEVDVSKTEIKMMSPQFLHIGSTTTEGKMIHRTGFGGPIDYAAQQKHGSATSAAP